VSMVTTHVLDTSRGGPARNVMVVLEQALGDPPVLATGLTDTDGRVDDLGPNALDTGTYRLRFNTGGYFGETGTPTFYPEVVISFEVTGDQHYHVPLLLSPFGYSTYRGS